MGTGICPFSGWENGISFILFIYLFIYLKTFATKDRRQAIGHIVPYKA